MQYNDAYSAKFCIQKAFIYAGLRYSRFIFEILHGLYFCDIIFIEKVFSTHLIFENTKPLFRRV